VLVRVQFSSVNPVDAGVRAGRILPYEPERFPMMLGWDGAGLVEAVGRDVTELRPGDRVMAMSVPLSSGIGLHAEYAALPLEQVVALSGNVSLKEAAATPLAGITALNAVEALGLAPGSRVHVNNPLGAVGRFAIQIAEALSLDVVDLPTAGGVDGAVDVRGGPSAWETFKTVRDGGAYATVIPEWWKPGGVYAPARGITPLVVENAPTRSDLARLAAWLAAGNLSPQIEAVLPLADGAEAHRRLEVPGLNRKIILDHGA
jgi:NADPH:quinone reductase-like Zn-dependent oxidoreductase